MVAGVVVLVVGVFASIRGVAAQRQSRPDVDSAAMASSSDWWPSSRMAQFRVFDDATWSGFLGPSASATDGPYVHVEHGRRRTWAPPADGDAGPPVRVWMFGGSALFGIGQRDEHTVASQLARAAWEEGIRLEVSNFGFHADVHWMERNRLVAALAASPERPDLVIFYDGFNEAGIFSVANGRGVAGRHPFLGTLDAAGIEPDASLVRRLDRLLLGDPTESPPTSVLRSDELEALAVRQYRESIAATQRLVLGRRLRAVFVFQPSRASRSAPVAGEGSDPVEVRAAAARWRSELPAGVTDLSGVFDRTEQPVYFDGVHTNELGADIVARAIYDRVRPELIAASASEER
jgi:lysophospholipase L1-like esterase